MSFLKDFASLVQNVFTLSRELERNRAEIKDLRQDVQVLTARVEQLAAVSKIGDADLANAIKLVSAHEASEREKLTLQLQIALLKFGKQQSQTKGDSDEKSVLILPEGEK